MAGAGRLRYNLSRTSESARRANLPPPDKPPPRAGHEGIVMPGRTLPVLLLLLIAPAAQAQVNFDEPPRPYKAPRLPARAEVERRDALYRYVDGLLCERGDRLLEALKAYEESARLDPTAAAAYKAQVSILLALDRPEDALAACRKTLERSPGDHATWYISARIHKALGKPAEARAALVKGLATEGAKEHPEAAQQMYFELGNLHELGEQYAEAAAAFTKAAAILEHPDLILEKGNFDRAAIRARAAETYERIGNLYRKAKQFDKAIEAYRHAQQRAPERASRLSYNLAQLCHEQSRDAEALKYLDDYLRLQPPGLDAYEMKIALLDRLKRGGEALPWLEQTARADKHNTGLQLLLAREYGRAKQHDQAEALYLRLAEASPAGEAYRGLFHLWQQRGQTDRILATLDKMVETATAKKQEPGAHLSAARAKAMIAALREDGELAKGLVQVGFQAVGRGRALQFETLHLLAVLADRHRKAAEAEAFYRRCLRAGPGQNEALLYAGLLRVLLRARRYEQAVEVCQSGLRQARATNKLLFYNDLARANAALERYDAALKAADDGTALAGDDTKITLQMLRVRILAMAERYDQAETECLALLKAKRTPGEVLEVRYVLATVYSTAKQKAKAEEQLQLILKADPSNATANNDLGYTWAEQGKNLVEAEAMIRRALEQDRRRRRNSPSLTADEDVDNASYVDSLGWVLFRRGQFEEARQELERATKLPDSDDPVIWDHLGDVYFRLHRGADARAAWERALRCYEEGRRRTDDRHRDLQRKLKVSRDQANSR